MNVDPFAVFVIAVMLGVGAFYIFGQAKLFGGTPDADVHRIHADLEGLIGEAGPNKRVLDIVRDGSEPGGRYSPPKRRYVVTLQGPDGMAQKRVILIEAGLFGPGALTLGPVVSRDGKPWS